MTLIISCIPFIALLLLNKWLMKYTLDTSLTDMMKETSDADNMLNFKERDRYLKIYFDLWINQNIRTLASISTDLFYHSTQSTLRLFNRLGLKRELVLQTPVENCGSTDISVTLGNVAWTAQSVSGRYRERLVDNVTNKVLRDKDYKTSSFTISLNKNPNRTESTELFCSGCGTPVKANGELFICPNCGVTYTSDSYDWVINQAKVTPPPSKNPLLATATLAGYVFLALPVLGLLSYFITFLKPIALVLSILLTLGAVGYVFYAMWYYSTFKKLQQFDPLFSMFRLSDRVDYLLRLFIQCRSDDRGRMRQFMDENAYGQWQAQDNAITGNHIMDFEAAGMPVFKDFKIANGRQHVEISFPLKLWVWNERTRQLQPQKRTVKFGIYRNENTRYKDKLSSEVFICKGCGMSVNLTADGKCKYCGNTYDIADLDWKIEWLDNSLYL